MLFHGLNLQIKMIKSEQLKLPSSNLCCLNLLRIYRENEIQNLKQRINQLEEELQTNKIEVAV